MLCPRQWLGWPGCRESVDFREAGSVGENRLFRAQKIYDKGCRNEALYGNPLDEVFRTCRSVVCASPPAVTGRFWIASENHDGLGPLRTPPRYSGTRNGVHVLSPYAYQEASWLVLADLGRMRSYRASPLASASILNRTFGSVATGPPCRKTYPPGLPHSLSIRNGFSCSQELDLRGRSGLDPEYTENT
jgi:hypothetical protein